MAYFFVFCKLSFRRLTKLTRTQTQLSLKRQISSTDHGRIFLGLYTLSFTSFFDVLITEKFQIYDKGGTQKIIIRNLIPLIVLIFSLSFALDFFLFLSFFLSFFFLYSFTHFENICRAQIFSINSLPLIR